MVTGSELKRLFQVAFDEHILRLLAEHIHNSYPDAVERAASLEPEFKRRLIPQIRHYAIQSRVRYVARQFPSVTVNMDFSDGNEPYTVLRSDNFYLTVSMTKEPGQLPRPSNFRQENATDNLFDSINPKEVESFYAILIHVPMYDNTAPRHLAVVFPDDNYSRIYEYMDLTSLVEFNLEDTQTPSEDIDIPEPQLRKKLPKPKKEQA